MNYYTPYELADTANKILVDNHRNVLTDEDQKDELTWNKSLFVAHLLYKSELELQLDEKKLDEEILQYNKSNGTSIQKEVLASNFLIRYVLGEVKIPSLVFRFSLELCEKEEKKVQYKSEPLFNELLFIGFLAKKYGYEDSRPFVIKKSDFQEIYHKFAELYLHIPPETEILDSLCLEEDDDNRYHYTPFRIHNNLDSRKVVACVWKLISNNQLIDDIGIIKKWLLLTEQFHGCDFIQMLDSDEQNGMAEKFVQMLQAESDLKFDNKNENQRLLCDLETHGRYETDLFLKNNVNILSINYNDYFLMWCTYKFPSRDAYISNNYRELYLRPLLSLVYINQYDEKIKLLLNDREKRPFVLFELLQYMKNQRPGCLTSFFVEKDYGLAFYFTFIDVCLDVYFRTSNEIKKDSIKKLLQESILSFIDKKAYAFLSDYQEFSRFLMYVGKYQNALEHRLDYVALKKNIYKLHIEELEKIIRKIKHVKIENIVDVFQREKDIILPIGPKKIGIEQLTFLFNLLDFANIQGNQESLDFTVKLICELYKANVLENKEHYISNEYKIMEEYNWGVFYQSLLSQKKLNDFDTLIRNSFIIPSDSKNLSSNEENYNVELYKFYLKSLCVAYRQNNRNVENTIIQILNNCFINDASAKSIDIFAASYEKSYDGNTNLAVFPLLIEVSNTFSPENQKELISKILNQGNIGILFSAYNLIDYEKGRVLIKDYIAKNDFTSKINEIYNFSEFIDIAANVANSGIDEEFEKLLFERLNEITKAKFSEKYVNEYTYRIELLNLFQLYKKGDLDSLGKYVFPYKDETGLYKEYKNAIQSARLFYLGFVFFEKWSQNTDGENLSNEERSKYLETSINCFSDLVDKFPDIPKYKYYKLYVDSFALNETSEKEKINALIELVTQELKNAKENTELLLYTKLRLYTLEKNANLAYCFFETLGNTLKRKISFAYLITKSLIKENLVEQAIAVYNNIDSAFYKEKEYEELSLLLPINQTLADLQEKYYRILHLPDKYRFGVLPENINDHRLDLGQFILNEITDALHKTLQKIDLVEKISAYNLSEDNISDLLELEINSRLSMLQYKIDPQGRIGKSKSKKNAGEPDFKLDFKGYSILIEAVKFSRGSQERKDHIEKIYNYDPSRKYLYNLIYFDSNGSFDNSWNDVKHEIEIANYPSNCKLLEIEDVPSDNAGIKIAIGKHNSGVMHYHIMANFYYAKSPTSIECCKQLMEFFDASEQKWCKIEIEAQKDIMDSFKKMKDEQKDCIPAEKIMEMEQLINSRDFLTTVVKICPFLQLTGSYFQVFLDRLLEYARHCGSHMIYVLNGFQQIDLDLLNFHQLLLIQKRIYPSAPSFSTFYSDKLMQFNGMEASFPYKNEWSEKIKVILPILQDLSNKIKEKLDILSSLYADNLSTDEKKAKKDIFKQKNWDESIVTNIS